ALDDWTPATETAIVSKYIATNDHRSYMFVVRSGSTGLLRLYWSEDGVNLITVTSSIAPTVSNGDWLWIGVILDVDDGPIGQGRVIFYTGGSGVSPTWVQLGDTAGAGSVPTFIFDGLHPVEVGAYANGSAGMLQGKITNVRIYSDLTETTLEFDTDFTDLTVPEIMAAEFTEDSPNAAGVMLNGTEWLYSGLTVLEYGDTLLAYLQARGATSVELVGALNELNGTTGVEYDLAYRTYFNI
ncbi:hypothetical protein LCGC14_2594660, partial [marine sediment metagenome]